MAKKLDLARYAGDTENVTLRFFTDSARTTALSLSGRTFAWHVETTAGTETLAQATVTPSGASTNELVLNPDTGGWEDLTVTASYVWSLWETTGSATETLFNGRVTVANR